MSEPQLISPLLDGFVMGDPISSCHGVQACPAMHLETDKKYIVKIISLPANQAKLEALLLTGAYSDRESALEYFKEQADGVLVEAELLEKLSKNEGFVSFDNWQMVPMEENETGFDIYLLGQYRPTLEGVLDGNEMTHLQAINLGLDLCAALSVCRRYGYIYSNLKPSNIYLCNEREFRIGDLGFLSLDSLEYASLPDKYHSDYTSPEIVDAFSALNGTMDTYALGLILYQAYNDGILPPLGIQLEAPRYADPALSEIILKACAVDPAERWQDPAQMGQALANYLQSNTVNDTPIAPAPVEEETEEIAEIFPDEDTEPSTEDILAEVDQAMENAPAIVPAPAAESAETAEVEKVVEQAEEITETDECESEPEIPEEVTAEETDTDISEVETPEPTETDNSSPEESAAEMETETDDEAAPETLEEESEHLDETAQMLAQADDLIAYQLPDPPVAPEPYEVTLPEPPVVIEEEPEEPEESAEVEAQAEEITEEDAEESDDAETEETIVEETPEFVEEEVAEDDQQPKPKRKGLAVFAIVLSIVLFISLAVALAYQFLYIQTIDKISLRGREDHLSVILTTDIPDDKLIVKCVDPHGNALTANVESGVATFVGLKPGTKYTLEVRINGFHKLIGETTQSYTTGMQTTINGFYASTGPEDGSVILSFTQQGPDSSQWTVTYSAAGEVERSATFSGHMVTLTGLTIGKEYTFKLSSVSDLYLSGTDEVTYTISKLVYAKDLRVLGLTSDGLAIAWNTPEGVSVPKWYIRCYNEAGYDVSKTTTDNIIYFEGLDTTTAYTIEVTAEGMTMGSRIQLSANPLFVKNIKVDASNRNALKVTWDYEGTAPSGKWVLYYSIDGSTEQNMITCEENSCIIAPWIPGAHYTISISASGSAVLSDIVEYDAPPAAPFNGYLISSENITFSMCKTPDKPEWNHNDVAADDYTTTFQTGVSASIIMQLDRGTSKVDDIVVTLYVVRDADGKLVSAKYESRTWDDMWYDYYGELTLPEMPKTLGNYTVDIYFNGTIATTQSFTIVE